MAECIALLGDEPFNALIEGGTLVRLNPEVVYLSETVSDMEAKVREHIRQHGSITVAQARDALDASRKYALALLEHLDERRVTRRVGDTRVLR